MWGYTTLHLYSICFCGICDTKFSLMARLSHREIMLISISLISLSLLHLHPALPSGEVFFFLFYTSSGKSFLFLFYMYWVNTWRCTVLGTCLNVLSSEKL